MVMPSSCKRNQPSEDGIQQRSEDVDRHHDQVFHVAMRLTRGYLLWQRLDGNEQNHDGNEWKMNGNVAIS